MYSVPPFECELVLRSDGEEKRQPHVFLDRIRPGTTVFLEDREWIVAPEVFCRPAPMRGK